MENISLITEFPPEHNIKYQWGSQYRGFSFKIFEKISKPVPVGVEYLNQVILVDGWKTWSSSFTFLFYCWSSSSQFHQPTCCFSSEAGNLSSVQSLVVITNLNPSQEYANCRIHPKDHLRQISRENMLMYIIVIKMIAMIILLMIIMMMMMIPN